MTQSRIAIVTIPIPGRSVLLRDKIKNFIFCLSRIFDIFIHLYSENADVVGINNRFDRDQITWESHKPLYSLIGNYIKEKLEPSLNKS